jgi:hypothetical protein
VPPSGPPLSPHVLGSKHLPPALIALPLAAAAAFALERWAPGFAVETLRTRFQFVVDGVAASRCARCSRRVGGGSPALS